MSLLPETLTPDLSNLTSNSIFLTPRSIWGRLCPTIRGVQAVDLDGAVFRIGRNANCHVIMDRIPRKYLSSISNYHFEILKEPDVPALITDLSKNGTFLNGVLIGKGNSNILQNNDEISMGLIGLKVFVFKSLESYIDNYLPTSLKRKFEISRLLGNGACGEVKLAFDKYTCRRYAIKKIVKAQYNSNALNHPTKIRNEIKILLRLEHPTIISVKDVVDTEENVFIIMDYMEGGELTRLIRGPPKLTEYWAKFLFYQMVMAVQYLHRQGVIHRDLKPENVLLKCNSVDTLIKVSDFGLSKIIEEDTVMRTVCGTPDYVAPEVLDNKIICYDGKVDVWSLGVILYYMLTQQLPFRAQQKRVIFMQILSGKCDMSGSAFSNISANCKDLLTKMLTVNSNNRLSVDEIVNHPWLDDRVIQNKVNDLLYSELETEIIKSDCDSESSDGSEDSVNLSKKIRL